MRPAIARPVTHDTPGQRAACKIRAVTGEREGMRSCVDQTLRVSCPDILRGNRALDSCLRPQQAQCTFETDLGVSHDAQRVTPQQIAEASSVREGMHKTAIA